MTSPLCLSLHLERRSQASSQRWHWTWNVRRRRERIPGSTSSSGVSSSRVEASATKGRSHRSSRLSPGTGLKKARKKPRIEFSWFPFVWGHQNGRPPEAARDCFRCLPCIVRAAATSRPSELFLHTVHVFLISRSGACGNRCCA